MTRHTLHTANAYDGLEDEDAAVQNYTAAKMMLRIFERWGESMFPEPAALATCREDAEERGAIVNIPEWHRCLKELMLEAQSTAIKVVEGRLNVTTRKELPPNGSGLPNTTSVTVYHVSDPLTGSSLDYETVPESRFVDDDDPVQLEMTMRNLAEAVADSYGSRVMMDEERQSGLERSKGDDGGGEPPSSAAPAARTSMPPGPGTPGPDTPGPAQSGGERSVDMNIGSDEYDEVTLSDADRDALTRKLEEHGFLDSTNS